MAAVPAAYQCGQCDDLLDPEDLGEPVYECSRCGQTGIGEDFRQCPSCGIFTAKVSDSSCPGCEAPEEDLEALTEEQAEKKRKELEEEEADRERRRPEMEAESERRMEEHRRRTEERTALWADPEMGLAAAFAGIPQEHAPTGADLATRISQVVGPEGQSHSMELRIPELAAVARRILEQRSEVEMPDGFPSVEWKVLPIEGMDPAEYVQVQMLVDGAEVYSRDVRAKR